MQKVKLTGNWQLYFFPQTERESAPSDLFGRTPIAATVPGNVETDLMREGLLPADLYRDENVRATEQYETYEWWYQTDFVMPATEGRTYLYFEGVDCLAEYWLDGERIGASDNMFIPYRAEVKNPIAGKTYRLTVRIRSALLEAEKYPYDMLMSVYGYPPQNAFESLHIRKARHSYGWDISPRVVSAGIWKDVFVLSERDCDFSQVGYFTETLTEKSAGLTFFYELNASVKNCTVQISGKCGNSHFEAVQKVHFKVGRIKLTVENPKLWFPKHYGEPNLYETSVKLLCGGEVLSEEKFSLGIRTAELHRTDVTDGKNGEFAFYINGKRIQVTGTNWVPLDPLHSKEKEKYPAALALLDDVGCNMVRCWGGNVYPEDELYDFCDRHGILIWQDFALACGSYPQDDGFAAKIRDEAEWVVRHYRRHPSLVLWAGDNECDQMIWYKVGEKENRLTREVLKNAVFQNDVKRPYLPSSPYVAKGQKLENASERHLWGPRDYFKSSYYKDTTAHFASELGYHAFPSPASVKAFLSGDLIPAELKNNPAAILHSTDYNGEQKRFLLMEKQIAQLFGKVPETVGDFSLASQISQAEANKFFIELFRSKKPLKSGVIWWNLIDGWPQFSDAVVDYYGRKKLAYDFIRTAQEPVTVMVGEMEKWNYPLLVSNDSSESAAVAYCVTDLDSGKVLAEGKTEAEPEEIKTAAEIPLFYSDQKMLCIDYTVNGEKKRNHYLAGLPPFSLEHYRTWLDRLGIDWRSFIG